MKSSSAFQMWMMKQSLDIMSWYSILNVIFILLKFKKKEQQLDLHELLLHIKYDQTLKKDLINKQETVWYVLN